MKIKTRFAPSPTGNLHIGGIRTALYSWLFAKSQNGIFSLRIEDTDIQRSNKSSIDTIINSLTWLNLTWDEGPILQSTRLQRYREVIEHMLSKQLAYKCYCTVERLKKLRFNQLKIGQKPRYDGKCRDINKCFNNKQSFVIRFRNNNDGSTEFYDLIRGRIKFNNNELDDLIIQRSDGSPTYNFCVVIDDYDMSITHVIRGEEHINNTPRQINILHALGAPIPHYAHVPIILGQDGKKLSKRHGAVSVMQYHNDGFLPEAILNYLVCLGWSYGNKDIFDIEEMKTLFTINAVNKSPSRFDLKKLLWYNHYYINQLPKKYVAEHLLWHILKQGININNGPELSFIVKILGKRCNTLQQIVQNCDYFYHDINIFNSDIFNKYLNVMTNKLLKVIYDNLNTLNNWTPLSIHSTIHQTAKQLGLSIADICMPLRIAVTGNNKSPALDMILYGIGKSRCLARISLALNFISKQKQK